MRKIDVWATLYHRSPYLAPLSSEQLGIRHKCVIANGTSICKNNKISVDLLSPWDKLHVELQAECARRGIGLRELFLAGANFREHLPEPPDPVKFSVWRDRYSGYLNRGYLFRFLELDHAVELLEDSKVYFGKAASYTNPTLTAAQMDDERSLTIWKPSGRQWEIISSPREFFISSFTWSFDPRFITAFKKPKPLACIVLRRPDLYVQRLKQAVRKLEFNARFENGSIRYTDPLRTKRLTPDAVRFTKDFLYTYQNEYRFALTPYIDVDANALYLDCVVRDICDLIIFD